MLTLIKQARIYAPEDRGVGDILIAGDKIWQIADRIDRPTNIEVEVIEAEGRSAVPGLIDLHVHVTGGGGEGGPATRAPEATLTDATLAGVTTVVGLLGTDDVSRSADTLLMKTLGLRQEGLSAYMYCGSYSFPPVLTVTGSVKRDLALIPPIIGVGELAISDHRSAQPTFEQLARVAAEARVGGLLGGKPGLVHLHLGHDEAKLDLLWRLVRETEIPMDHFLPTHVLKSEALFDEAVKYARAGGAIDVTISQAAELSGPRAEKALNRLADEGIPLDRLTFSSDSNGSLPRFDDQGKYLGMGVGQMSALRDSLRWLITEKGFAPEQVLPCLTANPADRLKMGQTKGRLIPAAEADICLFDQNWELDRVYCRGRLMVEGGRPVVKGTFQ